MSDDARFDPRFDPAFQPGYDGPLVPARPTTPQPATPQPIASRVAAVQPIGAPPAAVVPRSPMVAPASGAFTPGAGPVVEMDPVDDPAPLYRNPFVIVLVLVAAALIGVGLYLVTQLRDMYMATQSDQFDFVTIQVIMSLTPLLIVLGGATAVAVLVLFAVRWRQR